MTERAEASCDDREADLRQRLSQGEPLRFDPPAAEGPEPPEARAADYPRGLAAVAGAGLHRDPALPDRDRPRGHRRTARPAPRHVRRGMLDHRFGVRRRRRPRVRLLQRRVTDRPIGVPTAREPPRRRGIGRCYRDKGTLRGGIVLDDLKVRWSWMRRGQRLATPPSVAGWTSPRTSCSGAVFRVTPTSTMDIFVASRSFGTRGSGTGRFRRNPDRRVRLLQL